MSELLAPSEETDSSQSLLLNSSCLGVGVKALSIPCLTTLLKVNVRQGVCIAITQTKWGICV